MTPSNPSRVTLFQPRRHRDLRFPPCCDFPFASLPRSGVFPPKFFSSVPMVNCTLCAAVSSPTVLSASLFPSASNSDRYVTTHTAPSNNSPRDACGSPCSTSRRDAGRSTLNACCHPLLMTDLIATRARPVAMTPPPQTPQRHTHLE
ncbi:hypothetical protein HN51_056066 [Arachis hypogaea]